MRNICHICFKSSNAIDYIFPEYYRQFHGNKANLTIFIADRLEKRIIKDLPSPKFYKVSSIKNFYNPIVSFVFQIRYLYLVKKILFFLNFLFNETKLQNFFSKFDEIYIDSREFNQMVNANQIFSCLSKVKKKVILVPHAPHYPTNIDMVPNLNKLIEKKIFNSLIKANRLSRPWEDTKSITKDKCININFPALNNIWLNYIFEKQRKLNSNLNYGFIFRPFIKKYNKQNLRKKKKDKYINSYEENVFLINIAKKIKNKYPHSKLIFKLHPSTNKLDFKKFYKNEIKENDIKIFDGSIHDFFSETSNIISFTSTSLIYAGCYNIFSNVYSNELHENMLKNWKDLDEIYGKITNKFKYFEDLALERCDVKLNQYIAEKF